MSHMAVSASYSSYVLEQFETFGSVQARRMFGGVGLYARDAFFGLIDDDVLYLRVDDSNRADYESRGCRPFRPRKKDPSATSMSYFEVPSDVLEDAAELAVWARKSMLIAAASKRTAVLRATSARRKRGTLK
jgi:DNA transformation protein and related proteins